MTLDVGHEAREAADGRGNRALFFLDFTCEVTVPRTSADALNSLVAHFRVARDPDVAPRLDSDLHRPLDHPHGHPSRLQELLDEVVATDPLCQRSLNIAKCWLEHCEKTHGDSCRPPQKPNNPSRREMPTRVLDVASDDTKIYLIVSQNTQQADGRYIALSHCWGAVGTPFITAKSNIQRWMDGIDRRMLPKTFQDAVIVARSLGVRYLWIYSLCIIQQDLEDW